MFRFVLVTSLVALLNACGPADPAQNSAPIDQPRPGKAPTGALYVPSKPPPAPDPTPEPTPKPTECIYQCLWNWFAGDLCLTDWDLIGDGCVGKACPAKPTGMVYWKGYYLVAICPQDIVL